MEAKIVDSYTDFNDFCFSSHPGAPKPRKTIGFFKVSGFGGLKNLRFLKVLGSEGLLRASWEPLRGVLEAWLQGGLLWASSLGLLGPSKIS